MRRRILTKACSSFSENRKNYKPHYREEGTLSLLFSQRWVSMKESLFQSRLIKKVKKEFPECVVLKNDPNYMQGIPDLLILHKDRWAMLEVKKSATAKRRPNQEYYISKLNGMSYASFVYPENETEVMNGLRETFGLGGSTRDTECE